MKNRVIVDLKGMENYEKLFEKKVADAVFVATNEIRQEAITSISSGSKTGRTYTRGTVKHQASAKGESPATDTGFLVNNIYTVMSDKGLTGEVESRAGYSAFLEFGTSKMGARPFMFPAFEKVRIRLNNEVKNKVNTIPKKVTK